LAARVHIVCGPLAAANTQRLLARCQEAKASPANSLWLVPTRRFAAATRPALNNLATVLTLQQLADEVVRANDSAARPLSRAQQRLLIEDVIADLHAQGKLPLYQRMIDRRAFPEQVLGMIQELRQSGASPEKLKTAMAAGDDRCQQWAVIYDAYHRRLKRFNLYDEDARVAYCLELLCSGRRAPFASFRVAYVDGFAEWTQTQHRLLEAMVGWLEELWISLPGESGDERAELFARSRSALAGIAAMGAVTEKPAEINESNQPAGLLHLQRQLFRRRREVERSSDAAGLMCIEAPGLVGEARMVAREIRQLLDGGAAPDAILVAMRDIKPNADLLQEVFHEYDIPVDVEGAEAIGRNPAIAVLLRTLRLADDDWPFAAVTAVLRSNYFRPSWPEVVAEPEVAQHSEALLRLLGEPRGRDAYLKAVRHWTEKVHPGWEDEQAEESRRKRMHDLAKRCSPFLERFFRVWDDAPERGTLAQLTSWLRQLAETLGIARAAAEDERDAAALTKLNDELDRWAELHGKLHGERPIDFRQWLRILTAITAAASIARTPRSGGRVKLLSAKLACGLPVDYLFLIGLGERGFPDLAPPISLLDDQHRQDLNGPGIPLSTAAERLSGEMLLFYRLVSAPRRLLVLSYPAVDEKGQKQLPSSFLASVHDCFKPVAIKVQQRKMLIDGYDRDQPLSSAEKRVWAALTLRAAPEENVSKLAGHDILANLQAARQLVQARFTQADFTRFEGALTNPAILGDLEQRFGPDRILSPTALENYIACPFKFFFHYVLGLEPLEEPVEQIENTARGLAFHRALSRLHKSRRASGDHRPDDLLDGQLSAELQRAIDEQASRSSPAGEVLWKIEGQRLQRYASRYHGHWLEFVAGWQKRGVEPRPEFFEVSFGLPPEEGEVPQQPLVIAMDGVEVRISGRVDRVDVAELPDNQGVGFWIMDYKTGRGSRYTGTDLQEFRKLQLSLYALAAESVLLRDRQARPLGMAYWLVLESGVKMALPSSRQQTAWFDEPEAWQKVRQVLQRWVVELVSGIRRGAFPLKPRSHDCTATCDFSEICRINQVRAVVENKLWQLPLPTMD
jgi:ATP-dependent helicase/nuclease subunit B